MKYNYKELLDNNLSVNSYLWPNDRNPFEFIETVFKYLTFFSIAVFFSKI